MKVGKVTASILALCAGMLMMFCLQATAADQPRKPATRGTVRRLPADKNSSLKALRPDLVISSAVVTPICGGGGTWTANITATVKNQSQVATADLSQIPWHQIMAADWWFTAGPGFLNSTSVKTVKPQIGGPKELKPGATWTGKLVIGGIPLANIDEAKKAGHPTSQFGFSVKADPMNGVAEGFENNNEKRVYLPMTTCFKP